MPTIAVYKDGKKVAEHVASETGTGSFQKVQMSYTSYSGSNAQQLSGDFTHASTVSQHFTCA